MALRNLELQTINDDDDAHVRLSVCLCARVLRYACMDLVEILRVDRCRDMDELITFEPDPDHSPDPETGFTPDF